MKRSEKFIVELIKDNIGNRKLALRWKDDRFEKILKQEGLEADIYISEDKNRIDEIHTFPSSFLKGKSCEYYLVFPSLQWSKYEAQICEQLGFKEITDYLFVKHQPSNSIIYGNEITKMHSDMKVIFKGFCSSVSIGKNVKIPTNFQLILGNDTHVVIGNNVDFKIGSLVLADGSCLEIGDNCQLGGNHIFLNTDSVLKIGKKCTFGSGKIRSGRNRAIVIEDDCMFSWETTILAHDGHLIFDLTTGACTNNTNGERVESVHVGSHVWVGGETAILPNTYIGTGSICAYRSLVKGTYPNNCILGGSPARIIKKDICWTRENICTESEMYMLLDSEYRELTK